MVLLIIVSLLLKFARQTAVKISDFHYQSHSISKGKPKLENLPATYTENDDEALTLTIHLQDPVTLVEIDLLYTIFAQNGIIARSAKIYNQGKDDVHLTTAMSFALIYLIAIMNGFNSLVHGLENVI